MNLFLQRKFLGLSFFLVTVFFLTACLFSRADDSTTSLNDKDQIDLGWEHFRGSEYKAAVGTFQSLIDRLPQGSDARLQALYGLASTWNLRRPGNDPIKAEALYRQIISESPKSDLAAWCLLAMARMKHLVPVGQEPDYDQVRKAYQEVINQFPFHLAGEEAFIYQQGTLIATLKNEDAQKALLALQKFIETHPQSNFLSAGYTLIAEAYQTLHDGSNYLSSSIRALETKELDPSNPNMDNALDYWYIAVIAEFDAGDFETARKYYQLLMKEFPKDARYRSAEIALERMDKLEAKIRRGGI